LTQVFIALLLTGPAAWADMNIDNRVSKAAMWTKAEHGCVPAGFPCSYFLICSMSFTSKKKGRRKKILWKLSIGFS